MTGFFVFAGWFGGLGTVAVWLTNGASPGLAFAGGFFAPYLIALTGVWWVER